MRFERDDIAVPSPPVSVALGDLDGVHGKDIVIALWQPGKVGVMLNHGDGTFGALQQYSAGPECVGQAVEVELGDVTGPAGPFVPDGKLDAYVACTPYVVRLTGDGTGALSSPKAFQLYLPPYLGSRDDRLPRARAAPGRQSGPAAGAAARGAELRAPAVHQL